ncbi:MAG: hypothetical protein AAGA84_11520 [Pseudomonadota bacterium]
MVEGAIRGALMMVFVLFTALLPFSFGILLAYIRRKKKKLVALVTAFGFIIAGALWWASLHEPRLSTSIEFIFGVFIWSPVVLLMAATSLLPKEQHRILSTAIGSVFSVLIFIPVVLFVGAWSSTFYGI